MVITAWQGMGFPHKVALGLPLVAMVYNVYMLIADRTHSRELKRA